MHKNKRPEGKTQSVALRGDYLVYLCVLPFLLPLFNCIGANSLCYIGVWYLIFSLVFISILSTMFSKYFFNTNNIIISSTSLVIFFSCILISFSYTTIGKFLAFYIPSLDPGIFFSMVQAILSGKFGYSSVAGIYHFGTHQNYILILLAPIYYIFRSPLTLQFLGGAVVWGAGIVLWKIARLYFNQFIALCCVVAFYSSPSNYFYGFRPEIFYPLALFTLYYVCVTNQRLIWIILATLFLLAIKEDAPLYILGYVYLLFRSKNYKAMVTMSLIAVGVVLLNILVVQPYFVNKSGLEHANTLAFYSQWGSSKYEIATNLITSPLQVLSLLFDSTSGVWYTFGYWLFIPLLSPFVVLSLIFPLLMFTTSNVMRMHVLSEYYAIGPSALCFLGIIIGVYLLSQKFDRYKNAIHSIAIVLFILHSVLYVRWVDLLNLNYSQLNQDQIISIWGSAPLTRGRWQEFFPVDRQNITDFNALRQELLMNYKNANICATNQVYPHLDYMDFPNLQSFQDSVIRENCIEVFAITGDIWPVSPDSLRSQIDTMLQTQPCKRFGNFFYCNNLVK